MKSDVFGLIKIKTSVDRRLEDIRQERAATYVSSGRLTEDLSWFVLNWFGWALYESL